MKPLLTPLTSSIILYHLGLTLISWLLVSIAGSGLAYLFANFFHDWFTGHQRIFRLLVLFPWRSIVMMITLIVLTTPLMITKFGLGYVSDIVSMVLTLSVITTPWITSALLDSWFPASRFGKILSILRTTAILSIIFPVFLKTAMGYFIYETSETALYANEIQGYEVVGAMMLGIDLVAGLLQYALTRPREVKIR